VSLSRASDGPGKLAVVVAASLAITIWAGTPIVTKIAVGEIDAMAVGLLRTMVAGVLVAPLLVFSRARFPFPGSPSGRLLLLVSGGAGFVAFPLLFSLGVERTTSSHAALIIAAAPVFSGLIGAAAERRRPARRWWLGVALALAGEYLLVDLRLGVGGEGASVGGDLLVLASCLAAAAGYVAGSRLARTIGTWAATIWGLALAGLVLVPVLAWRAGSAQWLPHDLGGWSAIAYLAVLSSLLGYVCWYWALGSGGITRVAASQFAQPVMSLVLAVLILSEPMTLPLGLIAALILAGVAIAQSR
jgi:drug/metabolite transporter (DMT)-like permease